jgi:uncharacterized membrane protein YfcA
VRLILIGFLAGLASGLFGVGGGIVMVPLLVWLVAFDQHRAHATSLAAIVVIAAAGAIVFGNAGSIDYVVAGLMVARYVLTRDNPNRDGGGVRALHAWLRIA